MTDLVIETHLCLLLPDKKDREQLSRALQSCKLVVHGVDEQVAAYEKLMDIYRAFDSRTTDYMGKKFKVMFQFHKLCGVEECLDGLTKWLWVCVCWGRVVVVAVYIVWLPSKEVG